MSLIEQLGDVVDVVLETSHGHQSHGHTDLYREYIDMPILQSTLWDFEDLLTNDGCTGIAVLNPTPAARSAARRAQAADRLRQGPARVRKRPGRQPHPLPRRHAVHHRSRARPLDQRALRRAVRRTEDAARHGWLSVGIAASNAHLCDRRSCRLMPLPSCICISRAINSTRAFLSCRAVAGLSELSSFVASPCLN